MLGEHFGGEKPAIRPQGAERHHTLALTEQVRQNAGEVHLYRRLPVSHAEPRHRLAVHPHPFDAAGLDQPAEAKTPPGRRRLGGHLRGCDKKHDTVVERQQAQPDRRRHTGAGRQQNHEAAALAGHRLLIS